jgi:hypothetical protein
MSTVPIFAPDGTLGDIPQANLMAAVKAGAKPGVHITAPDGSPGVIPADRTQDAVKAGAKLVPIQEQPAKSWLSEAGSAMWNDIKSIPSAIMAPDPLADPSVSDADKWKIAQKQNADAVTQNAQRTAERGTAYSLGATANEMMGVNVAGEEQAAKEGNPGAVVGHAAAMPAVAAATAGLTDLAPSMVKKALLLGKTPEEAYQSALKPSTTIPPAKVQGMVQTGLEQGIPVSKSGAAKLSSLIDDLNDKVTAEIAAQPGRTVDPNKVAIRADQIKPKFENQVNSGEDLAAIEGSKQQFLSEQGARPGKPAGAPQPTGILDESGKPIMNEGTPAVPAKPASPMAAMDAQTMKQGTYTQLKGKAYGELKSASIEAQKALARGLKEELENAFPELHDTNQALSKAFDLQPVLEKAIQRGANHQIMGIGTPIVAGAAKAVTGSTGISTAAAALKAVVDNPVVKSRLAIALNRSGVPWSTAQARILTYSGALGASANAESDDHQTSQSPQ